jgi:transcriptional pleiotropic regulator of transition state genes
MIIKKIDSVGRIVIPMELRNSLGWKSNDEIELCEQDGKLVLTKHIIKQGQCAICGNKEKLLSIEGINICLNCAEKISQKIK